MQKIDINKVKQIAKEAGNEIMRYYHEGFSVVDKMDKGDKEPLTEADLASNEILQERLSEFGIPVLSEESRDDKSRLESEYAWIIDPIDGTSDFVNKTGEFCILVGLVKNGEPILGVIYEPATEKYYYAEKGSGAFIEEDGDVKKIEVSKENNFEKMKILVSRSHLKETELELMKKLKICEKIPQGSAIKFARVASGNCELYINSSDKTSEWDTCAGKIILEEAGGKMTDLSGNEIAYNQNDPRHRNGFVVSNRVRHGDVIEVLRAII